MSFETLGIGLIVLILLAVVLLLRRPGKARSTTRSTAAARATPNRTAQTAARRRPSAALPQVESDRDVIEPDLGPKPESVPDPAVSSEPPELKALQLQSLDDLDSESLERLRAICASMPEPHPVQRQLAGGLDTPDDLMGVVTSDAGLTAGILRTVNSAAFALASPITSVQHAITYLGVSMVKGLVAQAALAERIDEGSPDQQAALARIWRSAGAASTLAQMLGQELGVARPSVIGTKALFFNLGDVALVLGVDGATAWYDDGVSLIDRIAAQQAACGANTALVGSQLARDWNLPEDIAQAIESGLLPLTIPASEFTRERDEYRAAILMYLAGRIGDRVAFHGLRDISEVLIALSEAADLFHLPGHLEAAGLERVPDLLSDPAFRRKANRLLSTLGS